MTRQRVTVTDIARAAGVSRATVSLVLRDSPLVADTTRARVQAELRRQGYVYHRAAADLRRRTSSMVALILNDLSNPYFAEFAAGVDEILAGAGYVTLLGSSGESVERQQSVLASLMQQHPAGIILSPAEHSDTARLREVLGTHTPVLVFNRELAQADWDFLGLDNRRGAFLATTHLLAAGHRRIAFYGGHADSSSCHQRHQGYAEALAAAGLDTGAQPRIECAPTRVEAARQAATLLACSPRVGAAVCYNDAVALGLMLGLRQLGLQPGRDLAVTGFDDIPEAAMSAPPLTTVATAPRQRGREAARRILQRTRDPGLPVTRHTAAVELCVRESTPPTIDPNRDFA